MSYRKIEVDGQVFEYSIGKTHTKIRGVGAYKNEDVGTFFEIGSWDQPEVTLQVRPSDIKSFIERNKLKVKIENKRR
jgi:hypothetical protein